MTNQIQLHNGNSECNNKERYRKLNTPWIERKALIGMGREGKKHIINKGSE